MAKTTSVVVIGGSAAGIGVCHGLLQQLSDIKITLISPSTEYYYNIAAPRFLTKSGLIPEDKYILSIPDVFGKYPSGSFEFIQGKATDIDLSNKRVSVNATSVEYDCLVIASGSTTPASVGKDSFQAPFKAPVDGDLRPAIQRTQSAIQNAKSIIIGGAGPVGVEFAGEVAEAFGDEDRKEVTLVSGTDNVLPGLMSSAQDAARDLLRGTGITLKTSCLIEQAGYDDAAQKWVVTLAGGETLEADLYISATGTIPNNQFIPASLLNQQGWVGVNEYLQVVNDQGVESKVYALGDITAHDDRLLLRVAPQVAAVVANIKRDITGNGGLSTYLPEEQWNAMLVPIGRSTGTGVIGKWRVWGFLVSFLKGKDFMIGKAASAIQG